MQRLIALPGEPEDFQESLEILNAAELWDGVELPGFCLDSERVWLDLLDAFALPPRSLCSIIEDPVACHLADAASGVRKRLTAYLVAGIEKLGSLEIPAFSINPGLDRIIPGQEAEGIQRRAEIIRDWLTAAEENQVMIGLSLRIPGTGARQRRLARQLVTVLASPLCSFAVDLFPYEMNPAQETARWRDVLQSAGIMRFHYEPALGEHLTPDQVDQWCELVELPSSRRTIIFAPSVRTDQALAGESRRLNQVFRL